MINDVQLTPLRIIRGELGDVYHALTVSASGFSGFGEAYFSSVKQGKIKGWKKHTRMTSNFVVPVGAVRVLIFDDRPYSSTKEAVLEVVLSPDNYARLTVPPGVWFAIQGIAEDLNLLLNIASIPHEPSECLSKPLNAPEFPLVQW